MNTTALVIAIVMAVYVASIIREAHAISRKIVRGKRTPRYIYFIQGRGENPFHVKIGRTNDYTKRMKAHSTANPYGVYVLGIVRVQDERGAERFLHLKFAGNCIQREWFKLSPLLLVTILLMRDRKLTRDANDK